MNNLFSKLEIAGLEGEFEEITQRTGERNNGNVKAPEGQNEKVYHAVKELKKMRKLRDSVKEYLKFFQN